MALSVAQLEADLAHMIDDLPASVTIGAVTGSGALTPIDRAQVLSMTGMEANVDAQVVLSALVFTTKPVRNTAVSVTRTGGTAEVYRVVSCQESPDGIAWMLTLTKDTR